MKIFAGPYMAVVFVSNATIQMVFLEFCVFILLRLLIIKMVIVAITNCTDALSCQRRSAD